jgi:hypothetical protein
LLLLKLFCVSSRMQITELFYIRDMIVSTALGRSILSKKEKTSTASRQYILSTVNYWIQTISICVCETECEHF